MKGVVLVGVMVLMVLSVFGSMVGGENGKQESGWRETEDYQEWATFHTLSPEHILAHFQFSFTSRPTSSSSSSSTSSSSSPAFSSVDLFPNAWLNVARNGTFTELRVGLTRGRWQGRAWGAAPADIAVAPPGAELWIAFPQHPSAGQERLITNHLAGLLCVAFASIHRDHLDVFSPHLPIFSSSFSSSSFSSSSSVSASSSHYYASITREPICTENLTPLFKMLPCRNRAGLASLLTPRALLRTPYHSIALHHQQEQHPQSGATRLRLDLTFTIVFDLSRLPPSLARQDTVAFLFRSDDRAPAAVTAAAQLCQLASRTFLSVDHRAPLLLTDDSQWRTLLSAPLLASSGDGNHRVNHGQSLLDDGGDDDKKKRQLLPISVVRSATGYGDERGGVVVHIENQGPVAANVSYFSVLPNFLRFYCHQMSASQPLATVDFQLPEDRGRSGWLYLQAILQPGQTLQVQLPFEKVFKAWQEFPPDAHLGQTMASALLVAAPLPGHGDSWWPARIYTDPLLVTLPTPDFSMPYNTLMLAGTAVALFFGSIFNRITKHYAFLRQGGPDPDERPIIKLINFIFSRARST